MEQEIVPNMRIGLYGAGKIGQPIYTWLKSLNRYRIVLWVDNNYENIKEWVGRTTNGAIRKS